MPDYFKKYTRKESYSAHQILENYDHRRSMQLDGDIINPSQRYKIFQQKGCKCVRCGIEGTYFLFADLLYRDWET